MQGFLPALSTLFLLYVAPFVNNRGVCIDVWRYRATAAGLFSAGVRPRIITSGRLINERCCIKFVNVKQAFTFKVLPRQALNDKTPFVMLGMIFQTQPTSYIGLQFDW